MKAMVLAAGEGTRLRPFTLTTPKPMLPICGHPTLEWIFAWLRFHGIAEIVVNLCHQPDSVPAYFGDGSDYGIHLTFSMEQTILGTAGALKRVEHLFRETFVVVYGDVLSDMDLGRLIRFHQSCDPTPHVTLTLDQRPNPWDCGIVGVDERHRVTRFVEKPPRDAVFSDLVNSGILVCDPEILNYVPASEFYDISKDLLPRLLDLRIPIYGQTLREGEYLIDIGTPEKYGRVQQEWPTPIAKQYAPEDGFGPVPVFGTVAETKKAVE